MATIEWDDEPQQQGAVSGPSVVWDDEAPAAKQKGYKPQSIGWRQDIRRAIDESAIGPFVQGMVDPIAGTMQGLANLIPFAGDQANEEVAAREAEYQSSRPDGGVDLGRIAGNVLSPVSLVPAARAYTAMRGMGAIPAATGSGLVAAGMQPVTEVSDDGFLADKAKQAALAVATAPVAVSAGKAIGAAYGAGKSAVMPFMGERGARFFADKRLAELVKGEEQQLLDMMRRGRVNTPTGAPMTVGDVVAANSLAAKAAGKPTSLGRQLIAAESEVARGQNILSEAELAKELARQQMVGVVAKTPQQLAAAEATRAGDALQNYGAAYAQKMRLTPQQNTQLQGILQNPVLQRVAPTVDELVASRANRGQATSAAQYLHDMKTALDKMLTSKGDQALDMSQLKEVDAIRKSLIGFMKQTNPAYDKARAEYARQSLPINRMEIGQKLQSTLQGPRGEEKAAAYLKALNEAPKTIKSATGRDIAKTLTQAGLTKNEQDALRRVGDDLLRDAEFDRILKSTQAQGMQDAAIQGVFQIPKMLQAWTTITNAILRNQALNIESEVGKRAAQTLADPKKFQAFLGNLVRRSQADPRMLSNFGADVTYAAQPAMAEIAR